jgi:hypothetical protein
MLSPPPVVRRFRVRGCHREVKGYTAPGNTDVDGGGWRSRENDKKQQETTQNKCHRL